MAAVLGEGWDFRYAERLYIGLTLDLEDVDLDDLPDVLSFEYGFSLENLLTFRRELLGLVQVYLMERG